MIGRLGSLLSFCGRWLGVFAIGFYQIVLRGHLTGGCRFTPSCSIYTREQILRHGLMKGIMCGLRQLSQCHPWGRG